MKNIVKIEARVYAANSFSSEEKVELCINERITNPKFPQASQTYAKFIPNTKKHINKSTLDFLLLNQGKTVIFREKDKVVNVSLDGIPATFVKGKKKDGTPYYGIKADLSTTPGETHYKWFFADPMTTKMCEEFVTEHKFEESTEEPEEDVEDESLDALNEE